jgi:hypothetical protein
MARIDEGIQIDHREKQRENALSSISEHSALGSIDTQKTIFANALNGCRKANALK